MCLDELRPVISMLNLSQVVPIQLMRMLVCKVGHIIELLRDFYSLWEKMKERKKKDEKTRRKRTFR